MTEPSSLTVARSDSGYVVFLEGRATMKEGPAFCTFVKELLDHAEEPTLVVCVEGCDYMDSTFLGGLIALHKKYSLQSPPRFIVSASRESRARLLASARLDLILKLIDDVPECTGRRAPIPTPPADAREFTQHAIKCHRLLAEIGGPQAPVFQLVADQLSKELDAME